MVLEEGGFAFLLLLKPVGIDLFVFHDSMQVLPLQASLLSGLGNVAFVLLEYRVYVMPMKCLDHRIFCFLEGETKNHFVKTW